MIKGQGIHISAPLRDEKASRSIHQGEAVTDRDFIILELPGTLAVILTHPCMIVVTVKVPWVPPLAIMIDDGTVAIVVSELLRKIVVPLAGAELLSLTVPRTV